MNANDKLRIEKMFDEVFKHTDSLNKKQVDEILQIIGIPIKNLRKDTFECIAKEKQ